jgi:hypothetical protein
LGCGFTSCSPCNVGCLGVFTGLALGLGESSTHLRHRHVRWLQHCLPDMWRSVDDARAIRSFILRRFAWWCRGFSYFFTPCLAVAFRCFAVSAAIIFADSSWCSTGKVWLTSDAPFQGPSCCLLAACWLVLVYVYVFGVCCAYAQCPEGVY